MKVRLIEPPPFVPRGYIPASEVSVPPVQPAPAPDTASAKKAPTFVSPPMHNPQN